MTVPLPFTIDDDPSQPSGLDTEVQTGGTLQTAIGSPIDGLAAAVEEVGRVDALAKVIGDYKTSLKGYALTLLPPGGKFPIAGIAPTVSVSKPEASPKIDDLAAFQTWFRQVYPDETETRKRVDVLDHERAAELLLDLATDYDQIVEPLRAQFAVVDEILLPEKAFERIVKESEIRTLGEGEEVEVVLVHKPTSEVVPGTRIDPAGDPQLTLRFDKEWSDSLIETFRTLTADALSNITTPELPPGFDEEGPSE